MFRFRLQRVLELREKREQATAIQLVRAEESATVARSERDELQALRTASRAQITSAHITDPTVGHLHHLGYVMSALDQRLGHASQALEKAEGVVSEARVSLDAAARDRRVLDRLKDKHTGAFRAEESHRDRVEMDEVALARFTRQRDAKQRDRAQEADEGNASSQPPDGASHA
ncbi:MAG: flagellar export protein FliJ [Gemmatimonas sp.]